MNKGMWLLCICALVAGCEQGNSEPKVNGRWYTQSQLDIGKKVYVENCISCHNEKCTWYV